MSPNPPRRRPGSHGNAGGSFDDARVRERFGEKNSSAGASGEVEFRSAVERTGLSSLYDAYYSLRIPNDPSGRGARYTSDVDAALASGDRLLLVDVKRWAAGTTYWSLFGHPMKGLAPMKKENGEWALSANMAGALARYRANLPGVRVEAIVVFVPTGNRGALPSVGLLRWPGGIRSYVVGSGLARARRFLGRSETPEPRVTALLGRMLR